MNRKIEESISLRVTECGDLIFRYFPGEISQTAEEHTIHGIVKPYPNLDYTAWLLSKKED